MWSNRNCFPHHVGWRENYSEGLFRKSVRLSELIKFSICWVNSTKVFVDLLSNSNLYVAWTVKLTRIKFPRHCVFNNFQRSCSNTFRFLKLRYRIDLSKLFCFYTASHLKAKWIFLSCRTGSSVVALAAHSVTLATVRGEGVKCSLITTEIGHVERSFHRRRRTSWWYLLAALIIVY